MKYPKWELKKVVKNLSNDFLTHTKSANNQTLYKVITLLRDHSSSSCNWILNGWYELENHLNDGWIIERVDSFGGGGGWEPSGGALVYILSKVLNQK